MMNNAMHGFHTYMVFNDASKRGKSSVNDGVGKLHFERPIHVLESVLQRLLMLMLLLLQQLIMLQ
jgi:hypothetical protein